MQIEVTEKEALGIYSQRYMDKRKKAKCIPLFILAVAIIVSWFTLSEARQWLSLVILVIIASPAIYMSLRTARASGKYARKQIEEQG